MLKIDSMCYFSSMCMPTHLHPLAGSRGYTGGKVRQRETAELSKRRCINSDSPLGGAAPPPSTGRRAGWRAPAAPTRPLFKVAYPPSGQPVWRGLTSLPLGGTPRPLWLRPKARKKLKPCANPTAAIRAVGMMLQVRTGLVSFSVRRATKSDMPMFG